ncbi:glucokinase [Alteriqipengyuania lutimaris]|uniref:Glucokinase n=1 Tax=Alteriqipengyuania lutimaris TaxID=1538146 RepID=A0A395LJN8_9SPHN|nr:glucokinase [Alteriqipengyuania lutimaris]MBB3033837.1 glucokinase [Alteriqipengyuania lutimaris]RDS77193.1 glucokinase [Alteriqipengyuania lutimaris]
MIERPDRIVAVDIGGTHARFVIASFDAEGTITLGEPVTLKTEDHASFQTAWEDFGSMQEGDLPRAVAIAVAGPVGGEVIRFTNNPWLIRPALVKSKLNVDAFTIVNDFGAVGHAVARAQDSDFLHLTGPDQPLASEGTISIVGPGTGLGVAQIYRDGHGGYRVQATEGGHIDFAPHDMIEDAILARLRKRHNRVSVERVVSGPAIVDIYATLARMESRGVIEEDDRTIWQAGMSGEDSLAAAAVDRFCLSLGSVAGDIALAQGGFGGVVIAGGLGYRIRDTLAQSGFAERFQAKGRFQTLMSTIPVKIITHPQPGLFGAAAAFAKEHFV